MRDRQRQHLRAGGRGVDPERRPGRAGRGPAADGHRVDQRLPPLRAAGRVGRLQAVRHRPRARGSRARRVPRDQAHLAQRPARSRSAGSTGGERQWPRRARPAARRTTTSSSAAARPGCALANRLSADPEHHGAGARGGPLRLPAGPVHPHAGGAAVPDRQPALRLEVRVRARAVHGRPQGLPRPRQGARRLEQHQRDDLPARQPAGLRALGRRPGHGGLGLRPLPALLQADGDLPGRRGRVARRQRPAGARARPGHQPAVRRVLRGRAAGRLPADRRRQRLPAGGLRRRSTATSTAAAGSAPPGPTCTRCCSRRNLRVETLAMVTGLVIEGTRVTGVDYRRPGLGARRARGRRGDPVRRRDQLPAAAAALRHRPARAPRAGSASPSSRTSPASAATCRTTSRSTSSTPPSSRSRSAPGSSTGTSRGSAPSGCSCAAASAPPTTSRPAGSSAATTRSTTPT